jgi:hypothetical protein
MIVVLLLAFLQASAYDFELPAGNNGMQKLQYTILSTAEQTVSVDGGTTGTIPCTVTYNNKTYTVTEIGRFAFNDVNITDFRLPLSLKAIRENAFGFSKANVIAIPDGVETIEDDAFWYSSIETIIVGSGVKNIGPGAFYGCSDLKTLVFKSNEAPIHNSRNYRIGNSNTTIIVPQLEKYSNSEIAKVAAGSIIEPIFFPTHSYKYSGEIPQLNYVMKISSATVQKDMTLKNKDAGVYEQSFFIGLSALVPSYRFSDYDGYATYPTPGVDVVFEYVVNKKPLIITLDNNQRIYGDPTSPEYSYSVEGFVDGENENELNKPIEPFTHATITSEVGEYPITCSTSAKNYEIVVKDGVLTILKAPLTVQVNDAERLYGNHNPTFTFNFINLRNNDNPALLTPFKFETGTILSDVGSYPIVCSEGSLKNYEITEYLSGTLTINKAPLTLTALNAKRTYFEENPQFSFSLTGLRNNDDTSCITTQPTYQCSAEVSSDCGEYDIIPSNADAKNYEISYVNGALTITPAALTLKAQNVTREYGDENPVLTFDADGLKGEDSAETALQTFPTITSTASSASNAGEYSISITGGSSKNYTLSYRSGLMTITKAPLSVSANDAERIYGDSNPTFSRSYLGFKLSDSESTAFSVLPRIECTATKTSDVGEYPIMVSGGISRNYEIASYENAILTINPASAIITASDNRRMYFEDNPQFDYTVSGLRNSDTKACIATLPQYNCFASKTSKAGSYEIIPYGAIAQNYVFEYKAGSLIVNKRELTASIGNYSRVYGTDNPAFAISYKGFVNNEDASELNQTVTATCEATKLSDVGTYPIILSGGMADNYNISSYNNGNLTIEKANQTISWNQDLSNIVMYSQVALEAASTSNLPVTYEMSPNNVATLYNNGGIWYLDCYGSGAVSIRATQNGDKNHNAAPIITKTLLVYGTGGDDPSNPQIYLNVDEPGTLSSMIAENRKYQIKNLRLTGNLNGTDINFIREMAGSDSFGNPTPGILETLDISGCTIVSGGRSYYQSNRTSEYVVGDYMFYNCKVLMTLRLPENSISIGNSAFADCDRLSVIAIPNSVKSFGTKSFANAISLLRIPMPEYLTTIGDMAFMGCNGITELTLPESVSSIGEGIVNDCQNLSQIDVEVGNNHYASKDGVLYDSDFHELLIFPVNHEKTEYSVVDEVTSIAPYAFLNAKKLTTVNLPSTLASIGKDAFIGCVNLSMLQVKALNPPICQNDCFENVSKTRCELQVPLGCRSYYWVAPVWSEFNRIVESGFTGIENVESNGVHFSVQNGSINISGCPRDVVVRIYQTNGTLVFNSNATEGFLQFTPNFIGTYILLIGNTSYKIMIK